MSGVSISATRSSIGEDPVTISHAMSAMASKWPFAAGAVSTNGILVVGRIGPVSDRFSADSELARVDFPAPVGPASTTQRGISGFDNLGIK